MKVYIAGKKDEEIELFNIDELETGTVVRLEGSLSQEYVYLVVKKVDANGKPFGANFLVDLITGEVWDENQCERENIEVVDATIEIHEEKWK